MQEVANDLLVEFKERMHITHSAEDDNLMRLLSFSIADLTEKCGSFDPMENRLGKELVFERTRYAYNDSLEFFDDNFLSQIHALGLSLLPDEPEDGEAV